MNIIQLALAAVSLAGPIAAMSQANDAVAEGKRAYMSAGCYQCHGTIGQGGVGPRLAPKPFPVEALSAFVRGASRSMPPYEPQVLSDGDLRRIHAYLSSIEASPPVDQIPQLK